MVHWVWQVVRGEPGHPDQFPYMDSQLGTAQTLPPVCDLLATGRDRPEF